MITKGAVTGMTKENNGSRWLSFLHFLRAEALLTTDRSGCHTITNNNLGTDIDLICVIVLVACSLSG